MQIETNEISPYADTAQFVGILAQILLCMPHFSTNII